VVGEAEQQHFPAPRVIPRCDRGTHDGGGMAAEAGAFAAGAFAEPGKPSRDGAGAGSGANFREAISARPRPGMCCRRPGPRSQPEAAVLQQGRRPARPARRAEPLGKAGRGRPPEAAEECGSRRSAAAGSRRQLSAHGTGADGSP